jgi:hypothetical protein
VKTVGCTVWSFFLTPEFFTSLQTSKKRLERVANITVGFLHCGK